MIFNKSDKEGTLLQELQQPSLFPTGFTLQMCPVPAATTATVAAAATLASLSQAQEIQPHPSSCSTSNSGDDSNCSAEANRDNDGNSLRNYGTSVQLSEAATAAKRRVLAWTFVHKVNEKVETDKDGNMKASVELLYVVAYYGYGSTPTAADIDAAENALRKHGVKCEAKNLAVNQLRDIILQTYHTIEFPILGTCKFGPESFQTKLRTLGQYTVEGINFDDAYANLEKKRGEIEAKIEEALQIK